MEKKETKVSTMSITAAVAAINETLQGLSPEDRERVISSTAALFGIALVPPQHSNKAELSSSGEPTEKIRGANSKQTSLVEFLKSKNPVTNPQRITVIAYHREKFENKSKFSRADLLPYFATAKLAKPRNYIRDFATAAKEGWIHEDGENSYLTNSGEDAVDAGFTGKSKIRGTSTKKSKSEKTP